MTNHVSPDFLRLDFTGNLVPARPTSDTGSWVQANDAVTAIEELILNSDSVYPVEDDELLGVPAPIDDSNDEDPNGIIPMPDGHFEFDMPESVLADVKAIAASRGLDLTDDDTKTLVGWGEARADSMDYWESYPPVEVFERLEEIQQQNPDIPINELVLLAMGMVAVPSGLHSKAADYFRETLEQAAIVEANREALKKEYRGIQEAVRKQFRRREGVAKEVNND